MKKYTKKIAGALLFLALIVGISIQHVGAAGVVYQGYQLRNSDGTISIANALAAGNAVTLSQMTGTLGGYASLSGSYPNPSWISSLAWSKITTTPTTLAGYGITDALSLCNSANPTGQTGAVNPLTSCVNGGSDRTYRVGGYVTITAVTLDVIQEQVTYTDETGASRTQIFFPQGLTSANLGTVGAFPFPPMDIRVQAGATITIKTVLTTGTGSITYDVGGSILPL